jgi:hypothetical protein
MNAMKFVLWAVAVLVVVAIVGFVVLYQLGYIEIVSKVSTS